MGAITGALGLGGGAGGTSFGGPSAASQQGNNNMQTAFNQLQGVANGTGPNPAQDQYIANTQNLAKQQAGAIGSIQGISPALAARMASQAGSGMMQNAAAQGQANTAAQQLGAMNQLGNIGAMQQGAANQMQASMNQTNAGLAQQTMQNQAGMFGGLMGGVGGALGFGGAKAAANGGLVQGYASGGMADTLQAQQTDPQGQTQSLLSKFLSGAGGAGTTLGGGPMALQKGLTQFGTGLGQALRGAPTPENAGEGPTMDNAANLGGGIPYAQPTGLGFGAAPAMAKGGMTKDFRSGGHVAATSSKQKAVKSGNSYANDKIPAVLSEGEVVLPRSVMQSADPVRSSADFVAKVIAKRRMGK